MKKDNKSQPFSNRSFRKICNFKDKNSQVNNKKIDFTGVFEKDEHLIWWCVKNGLLKQPKSCNVCRRQIGKTNTFRLTQNQAYFDKYVWRCKEKSCRNIQYIRKGSKLFESFPRIKLKFLLIYIFTHFCFLVPATTSSKTLKLSLTTIRKISSLLSEWIVSFHRIDEVFKGKLGGKKKIVEVDESCFFKRKYNKGRELEQIWCFGMVERGSDRLIVEIVDKRDSRTLIPIIQRWVNLDTFLVVSDEWRSYKQLRKLKYNHCSVNHSKNFVDKENNQIHTQTIENRWGQIKSLLKKRGRISRTKFYEKLKETTWRITNKNNIQEKMLEIIVKYSQY